jgi:hypothetical protein
MPIVLKTLVVVAYAVAASPLIPQCQGSGESSRVERALRPYAARADKEDGKVLAVECSPFGPYRGRMVYSCQVRHRDVIVMWCASIIDGKLFTQDQGIPCPGPGGPNRNPYPLPAPG